MRKGRGKIYEGTVDGAFEIVRCMDLALAFVVWMPFFAWADQSL
jgi:hypothetical protein